MAIVKNEGTIYHSLQDLIQDKTGKLYDIFLEDSDGILGCGSKQLRIRLESLKPVSEFSNTQWIFVKDNDLYSDVANILHVIDKERIMYTEVLPFILTFLAENNYPGLCKIIKSSILELYGSGIVAEKHIFLFEDLNTSRNKAFTICQKNQFHVDNTVHVVLKKLAHFHGTFHAMKSLHSIDFSKKFQILNFDFLTHDDKSYRFTSKFYNNEFFKTLSVLQFVYDCYKSKSCNLVLSAVCLKDADVNNIGIALKKMKLLIPNPLKLLAKINSKVKKEFAILIHGDFHPLNIAYSETEAIFFDFQLSRYSDGIIDVHQYISQACSPLQRKFGLVEFLKSYHETLTETCIKLGMPGSPYGGMTSFMKEYQSLSPWQAVFGFTFLMFKNVTNDEAYNNLGSLITDLDKVEELDKPALHQNIINCIGNIGPTAWFAIQTLFDFVLEMDESCILNEIENL